MKKDNRIIFRVETDVQKILSELSQIMFIPKSLIIRNAIFNYFNENKDKLNNGYKKKIKEFSVYNAIEEKKKNTKK